MSLSIVSHTLEEGIELKLICMILFQNVFNAMAHTVKHLLLRDIMGEF